MPRNLTHLNALRAFEAAARLGSFARAAEELGVTPAAVGQQVRVLEDFLGRKLFRRTARGLRVTEAASPALVEFHGGFERLENGFSLLQGTRRKNQLSISVAPTFGWRWLAPRLRGLYDRCPQIDLRMDTSMQLADIRGGEFDIAVRYGDEERNELLSPVLLDEYVLPICASKLWTGCSEAKGGSDLLDLPLLHVEGETTDVGWPCWPDWGVERGLDRKALTLGPRYPQTAMALQAALDGQGVVLCGLALAIDDLVAGRLIAPLHLEGVLKTHYAYRLVYPEKRDLSAIEKTFMRWIQLEAGKTRKAMDRFLSGP